MREVSIVLLSKWKHESLSHSILLHHAMTSLLLSRIQGLDASRHAKSYVALVIEEDCVGQVHAPLVMDLLELVDRDGQPYWLEEHDENGDTIILQFCPGKDKTAALNAVTECFIRTGRIQKRHGDLISIPIPPPGSIDVLVDRNAAPLLGIPSVGVHLNCFNKAQKENGISLWMAQRIATKSTFPNAWDVTVAGGQPHGLTLQENLQKEAFEEAGIAPTLVATQASSVSCLSQMTSKPDGSCLKHSLYYCWDMQVSSDFVPTPTDGEVTKFELWNSETLLEEVQRGKRLRPAMRLVVTDFLIRHGVITPDNEPDYAKLQAAMHRDRLVLWNPKEERSVSE
jgi:isopentenyldiphosphate isomerase